MHKPLAFATLLVLAIAVQFDGLSLLLAVFTAVLSVGPSARHRAAAGWVRALPRLTHRSPPERIVEQPPRQVKHHRWQLS